MANNKRDKIVVRSERSYADYFSSGIGFDKDFLINQLLDILQDENFFNYAIRSRSLQEEWLEFAQMPGRTTAQILSRILKDRPVGDVTEDLLIINLLKNDLTLREVGAELDRLKIPPKRKRAILETYEHKELERKSGPDETQQYRNKLMEAIKGKTTDYMKQLIQQEGKEIAEEAQKVASEITPELIYSILAAEKTNDGVVIAVSRIIEDNRLWHALREKATDKDNQKAMQSAINASLQPFKETGKSAADAIFIRTALIATYFAILSVVVHRLNYAGDRMGIP